MTESDVRRTVDQLSRVKGTISLALIKDQTYDANDWKQVLLLTPLSAISLAIKDTVNTIAATQRNFVLGKTPEE